MISPEEEISREATKVSAELLPKKSRERYENQYRLFCNCRQQKKVINVSDDILLVYLSEKSKSMKASTLWSQFSMLKSCLAVKENVNVNYLPKATAFIKRESVGYTRKKSKVLTTDQIAKFMFEAPDEKWLLNPRTEDMILIGSPMKLIMVIATYIFLVKNLLPKYMEKRKPYNLRIVLMIYNSFQITINAYFVYKLVRSLLGLPSWTCAEIDYSYRPEALEGLRIGYHLYWLKLFDLLDTVFFILKKNWRQVSFLHVYHHSAVIVTFWMGVTFVAGGHSIWIPLINCSVHTLMFTYYLLTILDDKWKKSVIFKRTLTQIQLLQFLFFIIIYGSTIFIPGCKFPRVISYLMVIQNAFFIFLFGDFYIKTYVYPKQKKGVKQP